MESNAKSQKKTAGKVVLQFCGAHCFLYLRW